MSGLRLGDSPRTDPQDPEHARLLAGCTAKLPPVLVYEPDMTIIDGAHRYLAALLRGDRYLEARFFDGSESDAYIEGVRANVTHGKPLTRAERESAARRVVALRPEWSDRLVADACGVSPKTIGRIRRRAGTPQPAVKVGRDGKARPIDSSSARRRAAELLLSASTASPASLRSVARQAGTSLTTVRDVKRRLAEGRSPVPSGRNPAPTNWSADSAIGSTDEGRAFASWFEKGALCDRDWGALVAGIPLSRAYEVAAEARNRASSWTRFADAVEAGVKQRAP